MSNSFDSNNQKRYWTGILSDWKTPPMWLHCQDWTIGLNSHNGLYGVSDTTDSSAISNSSSNFVCSNLLHLLCVEQ